jgi:hypothetical protein
MFTVSPVLQLLTVPSVRHFSQLHHLAAKEYAEYTEMRWKNSITIWRQSIFLRRRVESNSNGSLTQDITLQSALHAAVLSFHTKEKTITVSMATEDDYGRSANKIFCTYNYLLFWDPIVLIRAYIRQGTVTTFGLLRIHRYSKQIPEHNFTLPAIINSLLLHS